jgi:hypothetical protein
LPVVLSDVSKEPDNPGFAKLLDSLVKPGNDRRQMPENDRRQMPENDRKQVPENDRGWATGNDRENYDKDISPKNAVGN